MANNPFTSQRRLQAPAVAPVLAPNATSPINQPTSRLASQPSRTIPFPRPFSPFPSNIPVIQSSHPSSHSIHFQFSSAHPSVGLELFQTPPPSDLLSPFVCFATSPLRFVLLGLFPPPSLGRNKSTRYRTRQIPLPRARWQIPRCPPSPLPKSQAPSIPIIPTQPMPGPCPLQRKGTAL